MTGANMSLLDIFKINEYKSKIEQLEEKNQKLEEKVALRLSVQQMKPEELNKLIEDKEKIKSDVEIKINELNNDEEQIKENIGLLKTKESQLEDEIVDLDEQVEIESFGIYKPKYDFANSLEYKERLTEVRQNQKQMIKNDSAGIIIDQITFNNSYARGKALQKKNIKQMLRSFNVECEAAINKVTHSNIERIKIRIEKTFDQLNRLNKTNGVEITQRYLNSKMDELSLAFEFAEKKLEEKEAIREQKQREREEKALQRELMVQRKKVEKDLTHFENMQKELELKIQSEKDKETIEKLKKDLEELKENITNANSEKERLDYREQNATAGYVYIISNIGSFGENVVKIGVTRRLEPMERIAELGSASVPFKFDVHALIFSYDAYKLESELHEKFSDARINKINKRKEYFKISIEKIEDVLKEYSDLTIDFQKVPAAIEYRESLQIK
ncbi:DUF4041 domain-containing protein [Companilactobacillus mishanensis]